MVDDENLNKKIVQFHRAAYKFIINENVINFWLHCSARLNFVNSTLSFL